MIDRSRRRFVQGVASLGALAGIRTQDAFAANAGATLQPVLSGNHFDLSIAEQGVNFTGTPGVAKTIGGSLPAPILRWREGETVTLNVTNRLPVTSSVHWHGIILPSAMDGVPGIATDFFGIAPGETFVYEFDVRQNGTYWYHSHSGFQEQSGMYGAIVIDPAEPPPYQADRDYVVVLSDWTDEDPNAVYAKLKKLSHYYNFNERTHADLMRDINEKGLSQTLADRSMWNQMRMSDSDLSDVSAYTYTYLMNGYAPVEGWTGLFSRGDKVLLRLINASAMTFFDLRVPGLKMTVVAADGQYVEPVTVDEIRMGVAETYDVIVEPADDSAWTIFAQSIDRTGFARGTLTPDPLWRAPVPELEPAARLSHIDMGMAMGGEHAGHDMAGMDRSAHTTKTVTRDDGLPPNPSDFTAYPITHAESEFGPGIDMRNENPQYRLDDPGVGLRDNGRDVLTYADLRNLAVSPDLREPSREIELHLTGNMARYMWSIDGVRYADAEPLYWKMGERLRITLVNDTMMNHPMHLHGMWSDLETGDNNYLPRKHTVIVQPGSRISYRVTVDAAGGWAYHCHLLYHMPGMMRAVMVE